MCEADATARRQTTRKTLGSTGLVSTIWNYHRRNLYGFIKAGAHFVTLPCKYSLNSRMSAHTAVAPLAPTSAVAAMAAVATNPAAPPLRATQHGQRRRQSTAKRWHQSAWRVVILDDRKLVLVVLAFWTNVPGGSM
jgi:hypothetical protein